MDIVFISKKQLSSELINAFVKRLALLSVHLLPQYQAGTLYLIKQMLNKYPSARSQMLEIDDDSVQGGFALTPKTQMYRGDINDPQVSNAGKTHIVFEMLHVVDYWTTYIKKHNSGDNRRDEVKLAHLNLKLAKCILSSESLP